MNSNREPRKGGRERQPFLRVFCAVGGCFLAIVAGLAQGELRRTASIPLPTVEGRIDHLAVDPAGHRLFVAALGNNSVEVVDLATRGVTGHITGLHHPQGLAYIAANNTLVVANADDPVVRYYDATMLKPRHEVRLGDDCDNVRVDASAGRVYVGYGEGAIAVLDVDGRKLGEVAVGAHPESFQLEPDGTRIFVNVPDREEVVVVDRAKLTVTARWKVTAARANFPMALDAAHHRIFVGCRRPAKLLALDAGTGEITAQAPIAGDTDDLFYDPVTSRVLVIGGAGAITAIDASHDLRVVSQVDTAAGARTGLFVADSRQLIVAAPKRGGHEAELQIYDVPRQ